MTILSIFGTTETITIAIIAVIVFAFEYVVEFLLKEDKQKQIAKGIGRTVFIAGLAVLVHLTLENANRLSNIDNELIEVNEKATAFEFFKPYETSNYLPAK